MERVQLYLAQPHQTCVPTTVATLLHALWSCPHAVSVCEEIITC